MKKRAVISTLAHVGSRCPAPLTSHPILLERPIVVVGDRAAIGRPPENVLALL